MLNFWGSKFIISLKQICWEEIKIIGVLRIKVSWYVRIVQ